MWTNTIVLQVWPEMWSGQYYTFQGRPRAALLLVPCSSSLCLLKCVQVVASFPPYTPEKNLQNVKRSHNWIKRDNCPAMGIFAVLLEEGYLTSMSPLKLESTLGFFSLSVCLSVQLLPGPFVHQALSSSGEKVGGKESKGIDILYSLQF